MRVLEDVNFIINKNVLKSIRRCKCLSASMVNLCTLCELCRISFFKQIGVDIGHPW